MREANLKFHGKVEGLEFKPDMKQSYLNHLSGLEGERVTQRLFKYKKASDRSNQQNRYYWGVVIKYLCDELGYVSEEMHEAIKFKFLAEPREIVRKEKKRLIVFPKSTTALTTSGFEDLMSQIRHWASADLSIYIPLPNEVPFDF